MIMLAGEMNFTDFYHKYVVIEADTLTEQLKDRIDVSIDDCYALCSSYCASDGLLIFNVLSIGSSWDDCRRGLDQKAMLGFYPMDQVLHCEMRLIEPDAEMIRKNEGWIERMDSGVDEDLLTIREDPRLDDLRDVCYPDIILAGIINSYEISEYDFRITGVTGPFLTGCFEQANELYDPEDNVCLLPYVYDETFRMLALFAENRLSTDEKDILTSLIRETDRAGLTFAGYSIRS